MSPLEINIELNKIDKKNGDRAIIEESLASRKTAHELLQESRNTDALERVISSLRTLRDFSDFDNVEFRALLMGLLFDLAEIHFALKDYKQSEKELEILFKVLDGLIKEDSDRFAKFHILAMELSTRILRSRKKAMDHHFKNIGRPAVLLQSARHSDGRGRGSDSQRLCPRSDEQAANGICRRGTKAPPNLP